MYLEISPRQSGKTTRLINTVEKHLSNSKRNISDVIFIATPNQKSFINILERSKLIEFAHKLSLVQFYDIGKNYNGYSQHPLFTGANIYYDEFDFIDNVIISDNGYYCTTPKKLRKIKEIYDLKNKDDNLINLLRKNKGKYERYNCLADVTDSNCYFSANNQTIKSDLYGDFIK